MADLHSRTLQSQEKPQWNYSKETAGADLVVVSLGGNDYNHQKGKVPDDAAFAEAYATFLDGLYAQYERSGRDELVVVSVCGQGSPAEAAYDPDNNRCRPCPHVTTGRACRILWTRHWARHCARRTRS